MLSDMESKVYGRVRGVKTYFVITCRVGLLITLSS